MSAKWEHDVIRAERAYGPHHPVLLAMDEVSQALADEDIEAWATATHRVFEMRRIHPPPRVEVAA